MTDSSRLYFSESIDKELHETYFDAVLEMLPETTGIFFVETIYLMGDNNALAGVSSYKNLSERHNDNTRQPDFFIRIAQ